MITHEGVGLAGVTVTPSPSGTPVTTDESGHYTITGLHPGSYTVAPAKAEYSFTPSAWTVAVDSDLTYVDFVAEAVTYSISGTIMQDGIGVAGVTVTPTPSGSPVITDESGIYTITGLAAGTYTITPAKTGIRFTPASQSVVVGPDQNTIDFNARTAVDLAFSNFSDTTGLTINGSAAVVGTGDGDVLRLVPADLWQRGTFFTTEQVDAATFSAFFKFRVTNPGGYWSDGTDTGGNGLAFVIQLVVNNTGGDCTGPGYRWIDPSIAVEFDTFQSAEHNDPSSNHLGINLNGDVDHGSGAPFTADVSPLFDDGNVWYAWVDYDGTNMEVRANQTGLRPATPTLSRELDLAGILGYTAAYVGFTAATDLAWGDHDILTFQYRNCYDPIDSTDVTIPSTDVPKTIPAAATMTSTATISGVTGKIVDVNVTLSLDFCYNSCLGLSLISPWGTRVNMINAWELYGEEGFVNTTLDDEAGVPMGEGSPPYTGSYIPATPLSVLDGEDVNGDWVLEIVNESSGYSGTLNSWSLHITSALPDPRAPVITRQPESQTGVYGNPLSFTVIATGDETLLYQWRKDGVDLSDSEHYSGTTTTTLNLAWVDYYSDSGNYTCFVSNAFGRVLSTPATLTVVWSLYGYVSPPSVSVGTPGKSQTFTVFASDGIPPYTYLWSTGDTTPSITKNAPGTFTCTVTDAASNEWSGTARYTISQTLPDSGTPQTDGHVYALAVQADGKIILGGWFDHVGGIARQNLARLNADGSVDGTFDPGANSSVASLVIQPNGQILVNGSFTTLAGQTRNYLGRLNSDGTLDESFDPSPNYSVSCIALQPDEKILIGGEFTNIGGVARSRVARLEANGNLDETFTIIGTNDYVRDILVQPDGKILVCGNFTELAGESCSYLGRLKSDGSLDSSFATASPNGTVFCFRRQTDGMLVIGGMFTQVGSQSRLYLARLDADDTLDPTFAPAPTSYVGGLTVQADGKILVGGWFTSLGGQPRERLGRLNADGSLDTDFDVGADSNAYCFAEVNGAIWVGGSFSFIGGEAHQGLSRLIPISASPYEAWKTNHFTPDELLDPNISGDMADPLHDGFPNLLKYATGSSTALSDGLARTDGMLTRNPATLTFTFNRNTDAVDVILHVLVSDSLTPTSWHITATCTNGVWGGPSTVSEVGTGNPVRVEVLDTQPVTDAKSRFMRLEIIKP